MVIFLQPPASTALPGGKPMTNNLTTVARSVTLALLGCTLWTVGTSAQQPTADLVITNARILTGTGEVLDRATLVVTDGRITSVTAGPSEVEATVEVDAAGMTVMPGLIDTHRHLLGGSRADSAEMLAQWVDQELPGLLSDLLGSGITTVLALGDFYPAILEVRRRLESGDLVGPRLLAVGKTFTAPDDWPVRLVSQTPWSRAHGVLEVTDPQTARTEVGNLAEAGVDGIKAVLDRTIEPDATLSPEVLEAIGDETERLGLPLFVHTSTVRDMLDAVAQGADRLVHTPATGNIGDTSGARVLRDAGVAISTTVSFWTEAMAEVRRRPWSDVFAAGLRQTLENVRHLWDEGVTVAFGTDSPSSGFFMAEVRGLSAVLSNEEIITALTRNAAVFLYLDDELGTLEPGKIADIVMIAGDPLSDIEDLANVRVVIKGGEVVVDHR